MKHRNKALRKNSHHSQNSIDDPIIMINYSFKAALNFIDSSRYINEINGTLYTEDDSGVKKELVGKFHLYELLLNEAIADQYDIDEIFDITGSLADIGETIFDLELGDYKNSFQKCFEGGFMNMNLLIIDRIEILPKYRGVGLGKKVIKDIYIRFNSSVGLIVLKPYPIQLENELTRDTDVEWSRSMRYDLLEQSKEKALKQLKKFYLSVGFGEVKPTEFLFMNMSSINKKLNEVQFEQ